MDVEDGGRSYSLAMHGGLGGNTLSVEYLEAAGLPLSLRGDYVESINRVIDIPVDIVLPSHPTMQGEINRKSSLPVPDRFVDAGAWKRMLESKLNII